MIKILLISCAFLIISKFSFAETVNIECSCKTKNNPSECIITTKEFQVINWNQIAHTNPNMNWDEAMLSEYCMRHKHDVCMCNGATIFSGKIQR